MAPPTFGYLFTLMWDKTPSTFVLGRWHEEAIRGQENRTTDDAAWVRSVSLQFSFCFSYSSTSAETARRQSWPSDWMVHHRQHCGQSGQKRGVCLRENQARRLLRPALFCARLIALGKRSSPTIKKAMRIRSSFLGTLSLLDSFSQHR